MISFFQIGPLELLSAFAICIAAAWVAARQRPAGWRWVAVIAAVLVLSMVVTPADPISMWLVAAASLLVFAAGVFLSPYLRGGTKKGWTS